MKRSAKAAVLGAGILAIWASSAWAEHAWNTYHWSRSGDQLTMKVGRNLTSEWYQYYNEAIIDWNLSEYIEAVPATGATNPKNCKAVSGRIEICNSAYGRNGWLGIAQIWLSSGHIYQGVTKLNDTYFKAGTYNTPAWRDLVTCQEIGHNFGLGHQDEDFYNADLVSGSKETCMDYTQAPAGNGQPNQHDYDELTSIYEHADPTNFGIRTVGVGAQSANDAPGGDTPAAWGRAIGYTRDGRPDTFEKTIAPGKKMITHVFWAIGEGPKGLAHE